MKCDFPQDWIALYVGDDLDQSSGQLTRDHLCRCEECAALLAQLQASQRLLKSMLQQTGTPDDCLQMRHQVMKGLMERPPGFRDWLWPLQRLALLGVRHYAYAVTAIVLVASASVLVQSRSVSTPTAAIDSMFIGGNAWQLPNDYRDWVAVTRPERPTTSGAGTVYVNPDAYRQYARTRTFPDGTVMVWAARGRRGDGQAVHASATLLVSVKSHDRFANGWEFFDFSGASGSTALEVQPLPASSGCRMCHIPDAAGDQVLTEF